MPTARLCSVLLAFLIVAACAPHTNVGGEGAQAADYPAPTPAPAPAPIAAAPTPSTSAIDPAPSPAVALQAAMNEYQMLAAAGGWATVPPGPKLEVAMQGPRVLALSERLAATHDLESAPSDLFDETLAAAVRRFQQRHGLAIDTVVGNATLRALNVPIEDRLRTMSINLHRLQSEQSGWGERYLMVNTAAATYRLVDGGKLKFERPAIVGRASWPTPRLDGVIERLDFNPYWTVPPRIASIEIFPKVQRDPGYLDRHHMHYVGGQIRQDPGADNPLGVVKFFFENPYSVYLHDTNNRGLFARPDRFMSHGCIRVSEALDLARYLLKDDLEWPESRIKDVVDSGRNMRVPLKIAMPIHIVYYTSWVDGDGIVQFRNDIYGRDRDELAALHDAKPSGDCTA